MAEQEMRKKIIVADIQLFLLAIIWGAGFVAGKIALETTTPFYQVAYRYIGAALFMLPLALPRLRSVHKKTLLAGMAVGALMFVGNCFQTIGLLYTTPAKQSFIVPSYTVMVPLLSFLFFREKPGKRLILAAFLAMAGIGILTLNSDLSMEYGDLLTLIFAFIFSLQVIITGRLVNHIDITVYTLVTMVTAAVLALAGAFFMETPLPPSHISLRSWMGIAYLGILNTALAYLLQNMAQRYAPASHTALIMSLETVFGTLFAVLLVGETFTLRKTIGCVVMFCAILLPKLPLPFHRRSRHGDTVDEPADSITTEDLSRPGCRTTDRPPV